MAMLFISVGFAICLAVPDQRANYERVLAGRLGSAEIPLLASIRRVSKLFVAIMLSALIAVVPLFLFKVGLLTFQNHHKERQKNEEMEKYWNDLEKAAREGKTGEATSRLFGIKTTTTNQEHQSKKNNRQD